MKVFEAIGIFTHNGVAHNFTKKVNAENEKLATEKVLSEIGGKQKISRRNIEIKSLKEAN